MVMKVLTSSLAALGSATCSVSSGGRRQEPPPPPPPERSVCPVACMRRARTRHRAALRARAHQRRARARRAPRQRTHHWNNEEADLVEWSAVLISTLPDRYLMKQAMLVTNNQNNECFNFISRAYLIFLLKLPKSFFRQGFMVPEKFKTNPFYFW